MRQLAAAKITRAVRRFGSLEPGGLTPLRQRLPHPIERPVFIIAPPRSGSTALFDQLALFDELTTFTHREAEHIWWRVLPYDRRAEPSDLVTPAEMDAARRRHLRASLYDEAVRGDAERRGRPLSLRRRLGLEPIRYLDKTISNCFHLDVIAEVFPDASFVLLFRHPGPNIASMVEGWGEVRRFGKRALTPYIERTPEATIPHWTFPAPPGWRGVLDRDLFDICAWSWEQHAIAALDFAERTSAPVHRVTYEDFVAHPDEVVRRLASVLGLRVTPDIDERLRHPPVSRTAVSPPDPDKWRRREAELGRVLPQVAPTAERLGYAVA